MGGTMVRHDESLYDVARRQALELLPSYSVVPSVADERCAPLCSTIAAILNTIISAGWLWWEDTCEGAEISRRSKQLRSRISEGELVSYATRSILEDLFPGHLRPWRADNLLASAKIIFISHRWITATHPDPSGNQLRELQARVGQLLNADEEHEEALVFYDYSSMVQQPRSEAEEADFQADLRQLRSLSRRASRVVVLSEGFEDYLQRGWCFFEFAVCGWPKVTPFDDQNDVRKVVEVLKGFKPDPRHNGSLAIATRDKFSYSVSDPSEAFSIVRTFNHLTHCRTTHPEDMPVLLELLLEHFNDDEMSAMGRLIVGAMKFYDAALVESVSTAEHGTVPAVAFKRAGVSDMATHINSFRAQRNWEGYVVEAGVASNVYLARYESVDSFPTANHVIHTILERTAGISVQREYFILPLVSRTRC